MQNSQENTFAGVSFLIKVSDWKLEACNFIKIYSSSDVFLWMLCNFWRTSIRPNTCEGLLMKLEMSLHKKMKFSIKDFFSKCDKIHRKLRIWSHLLKKSLMENFIFCAVYWKIHWSSSRKIVYGKTSIRQEMFGEKML